MSAEGKTGNGRLYSKLDPHIESIISNADYCQITGAYSLALKLYEEIIELDPFNCRALLNKANVLDHMGEYTEAIRWYDTTLIHDPYNAEAWYNKGITLRKTGAHEEGLSCIRKGISLAMGAPSPRFTVE